MSMNAPIGVVPPWTDEDRLIKARTHAGLSQAALASRLGVSERTIKRYEAGGARKRGLVLGWAMACGVNAQWLELGIVPSNGPDDGTDQDIRASKCITRLDVQRERRSRDRGLARAS